MARVKGPKKTIPKERASISTAEKTIRIRLRNPQVDDNSDDEVEVNTEQEVEVSTKEKEEVEVSAEEKEEVEVSTKEKEEVEVSAEEKEEVEPKEKDDVEPSHEDQGQDYQEKDRDGEHDLVQRPQKRRKREKLAAEEGANEGESQGPILYIDYSRHELLEGKAQECKRALEEAGFTVYTTQLDVSDSFVIRTQSGKRLFMRMGMMFPFGQLIHEDVAMIVSCVTAMIV